MLTRRAKASSSSGSVV